MEITKNGFRYLILALALFVYANGAFAQHDVAIAKGAAKYSKALTKAQWEKVLDLTYPEIITRNGGRQAMINKSKAFEAEMLQRGFELKKAELSEPLAVYISGKFLMCAVPMRLTFSGPLGKLYSESSLLAVSSDEGKTWTYIDMAQVQINQLAEIFPEINPRLSIPPKRISQD